MNDDPQYTAAEMIRIFGSDAENLALSLSRKFTVHGDAAGAKTWDDVAIAIEALWRGQAQRDTSAPVQCAREIRMS